MRDDRARLNDILQAIRLINKYASRGRSAFDSDELIQTWIVHHIEIIGEAVPSLSALFKDKHAEIPWSEIAAMRNILAHVYFGVDLNKVWAAVESDIPKLEAEINAILTTM